MRGLIKTKRLKRLISSLTYPVGGHIMVARYPGATVSPMNSASQSRHEITAMLRAWSDGRHEISDDLIKAVYDQLRRQARRQLRRERPNHTLDTGALINEAYLKLVEQRSVDWQDRGHFFSLAAELMRRILVDHARNKHREKRGGHAEAVELDGLHLAAQPLDLDVIALDEALTRLAVIDRQQVKVVELRYFAGLGIEETAALLQISVATVKRDWNAAKAWLKYELTRGAGHD
jgi:RNA polymerase sigma factor (TIGR02999 family)